ncbi:MAG TPA: head GIN domain-containing protein [Chitinophagaceae bacterium]|jgi:Putative auto-transporter adhesin, head GIN domain|nr:head GIN domain-containing protein [Chitinophagaceae bacterium]
MNKYFFLAVTVLLFASSCRFHSRRVSGNRRETTEQRNLTGFSAVESRSSIDVVLTKGDYKVTVKADENLEQYIITEVINGRLYIRMKDNISFFDSGDLTVYVSAPDINEIEVHGSGSITGQGRLSDSNKMKVKSFASGDIELEMDCPHIETEIHGSGSITLSGETKDVNCAIHASGDLNATNLKAETVKVSIHGSGSAEVFASESIEAEISASGDVHYKGDPKITSSVHGSGEVSKMD